MVAPLNRWIWGMVTLFEVSGSGWAAEPATVPVPSRSSSPADHCQEQAEAEVAAHYVGADSGLSAYLLITAKSFGPVRLWRSEDAGRGLSAERREERVKFLSNLFLELEYGRHLCAGLAEASTLDDARLLPGLMRIAEYHRSDRDYDCRAKWMAVAALSRQTGEGAVPLLISLVDHGNENTRTWARLALYRKTCQDFQQDKVAWARWWQNQGHPAIDDRLLQPFSPPTPVRVGETESGPARNSH